MELATGHASPGQHQMLKLMADDLAARIFTSGQIAGRPSMEALEQVIAAACDRVRGFPDESRGVAEAVMALLEDPKQELRVLSPLSSQEVAARYRYSRQREELDREES
jgi:hypothetical protein